MSGFSVDELAAIDDENLVEAVCGVVSASSVGLESTQVLDVLEASPEGFAIVYAVWLLDSEIRNGGFHQYFWNHEQVYVALTRRSLVKLDAQAHLALFEEVTKLAAPSNGRLSYGGVRATLEAFSESAQGSPLNAFDNRWYDLPEVEPLLVAFIRQNPLSVWEED